MLIVWRLFLIVVAALVTWRVVVSGISAHDLRLNEQGDFSVSEESSVRRPEFAYRKALAILDQDPAGAAALLNRAFAENPTDAAPLLALAQLAQDAGDPEKAAALVANASQLMPANPNVQRAVGNFWLKRGDLGSAMSHWSQALEAHPQASSELFPILLQLVEEPSTRSAFQPLAAAPPSWWEKFFAETARRALDLDTVRTLYGYRRAANRTSITREERDLYVRRLTKEGKIPEAYLVWVNGLDDAERSHLGIINNGNFEVEPSNSGFDWHLGRTGRVFSTTGTTAGVEGAKALHLMFRSREKRFGHVHQPLFLDPGSYRIEGMVRTDSLDSQGGLKWVVRCLRPERATLGESERFLGSSEWRDFVFVVQVPDNCTAQEIRLISAGRREFEHKMTGGVWFDQISMRKVPTLRNEMVSFGTAGEDLPRVGKGAAAGRGFNVLEINPGTAFSLQPPLTESLGENNLGD